MGILPVDAQMKTFGQESHTCRVAIDAIKTDGSITGGVTEKVNTLVGVG